ncbi:hypothetical protein G6F59_015539 [Rhizopus arrhizus]|nr:hypothetical protein G6F59_015539 [Rhizopus arrhizus]
MCVASAKSGASRSAPRRGRGSFSGATVSVTSGTTAGSAWDAKPSLSLVRPSVQPPSAKRTVLPAWRARRSRAQSSRLNRALSALTASREGVGRNEKGSMTVCNGPGAGGCRS